MSQTAKPPKKKVLAVASAGGHWVQLLRLTPAFSDQEVRYLTTLPSLQYQVAPAPCVTVVDANMNEKIRLGWMSLQIALCVLRFRPDVVISTGAAPGFMAIVMAKLLGARTIWVDSIANSEELSLAGKKIGRWADHWLTQWPELAREGGPRYLGSVI